MRRLWFKGVTAYEIQIGPFYFRFCHLMGGRWKWYTIRARISFGIDRDR